MTQKTVFECDKCGAIFTEKDPGIRNITFCTDRVRDAAGGTESVWTKKVDLCDKCATGFTDALFRRLRDHVGEVEIQPFIIEFLTTYTKK